MLHAVLRTGALGFPEPYFQRALAAVEMNKHSVWVWVSRVKNQERLVVPLSDQSLQIQIRASRWAGVGRVQLQRSRETRYTRVCVGENMI